MMLYLQRLGHGIGVSGVLPCIGGGTSYCCCCSVVGVVACEFVRCFGFVRCMIHTDIHRTKPENRAFKPYFEAL